MRTKPLMLVLLVAFATVAIWAAVASAGPGPVRPMPLPPTHATTPVPASAIVPKTATMLAGAFYPWVQPNWLRVGGLSIATLPHALPVGPTHPPAWIPIT